MAVAPTAVPADMPPPDPGTEPAADAPMDDAGADPWQPVATILKNSETGELMLITGDEPDDGSEPEGETFPDGPNLMRALMGVLEGGGGAEEGFAEGFSGAPAKPPMAA